MFQHLPLSHNGLKLCLHFVRMQTGLTIGSWVAQNLGNILVGGVLAQSAHDVSHLVEGHLAVTNPVKETESLLEVWRGGGRQERTLSHRVLTQVGQKNKTKIHEFETQSQLLRSRYLRGDTGYKSMDSW